MTDYFDDPLFLDLIETGRLAGGFGMHIEHVVNGGGALRRKFLRQHGKLAQVSHLLGCEELVAVHPSGFFVSGADLEEAAAGGEDLEVVAVPDGGGDGRFGGQFLAKIEGSGSDVGFSDSVFAVGTCAGSTDQTGEKNRRVESQLTHGVVGTRALVLV